MSPLYDERRHQLIAYSVARNFLLFTFSTITSKVGHISTNLVILQLNKMSPQGIRSTLQAYVPATLKIADLKAALSVIIDDGPEPSDPVCLETLKEDIQVEVFSFGNYVRSKCLIPILHYYLVLKRRLYIRDRSANKPSYGVPNTFLVEEDKICFRPTRLTLKWFRKM